MLKGVAVVLGLGLLLSGFMIWKYRDIESDGREDASGSPASVVIYSTPTCPYCHVARALFEKYDIDYFEYDITTSREGLSEFRELGGRAVPLILIGKTRIDGYNEQLIQNALRRAGLL
jgi:glutaredoxin 3